MGRFLVRLFVNALALSAAARFVPGIRLEGDFTDVLLVALVFGLVNAFLKPVVQILSFPFLIVTLGLFALVVNAAMLLVTAHFTEPLSVDGLGPAVLGSLVISVVSTLLGWVLDEKKEE